MAPDRPPDLHADAGQGAPSQGPKGRGGGWRARAGDLILLVGGSLLVVDLLAVPWRHIHVGAPKLPNIPGLPAVTVPGFTLDRLALQAPGAGLGMAALLLAALLVLARIVAMTRV